MLEKLIEKYLCEQTKLRGGRAYKWVSPGNDGVPDRIVMLPSGILVFVETKATGKKATALQNLQISRITKLGQRVIVLDSKMGIDDLFRRIST